jgi:murein L,D-transpeptidase YcbB/YkuD
VRRTSYVAFTVRGDFVANKLGASLLLVLGLFLGACRSEANSANDGDPTAVEETWDPRGIDEVRNYDLAELRPAIASRLAGPIPEGLDHRDWKRVQALYANYDTIPLWLEEDADSRRGDELIDALVTIHEHGLRGDVYPLERLRDALVPIDKAKNPTPEQLAEADVMLSAIYVALGEDLLIGQIDPSTVEQKWRIKPDAIDVDSVLARTLRLEPLRNALTGLRPPDEQYVALQGALREYRELATKGGWDPVPSGPALEPGHTSTVERLAALRRRLAAEGYLEARAAEQAADDSIAVSNGKATQPAIYDRELAAAVAAFQARHSIVVDSVLGRGTLATLNVPIEYRIGQIMANLERFRWLPRSYQDRYIIVNVPSFSLVAFEEGKPVLRMRVIVGAEYENRATPAFADSMSYVEFAPYWNVPEKIAEQELWPKQEADPTYFERNDYEVVRIGGRTIVRQRPGDRNALGHVKFMFPNDLNIYLHDTPERTLFSRDVRAFSHGCIRVEKPAELAKFVLSRNEGWDEARIAAAMKGKNQRVQLAEKVPIYIIYLTTFMRDSKLHFGNDIYDRDNELVNLVKRSAIPTPEEMALLDELRKLVD